MNRKFQNNLILLKRLLLFFIKMLQKNYWYRLLMFSQCLNNGRSHKPTNKISLDFVWLGLWKYSVWFWNYLTLKHCLFSCLTFFLFFWFVSTSHFLSSTFFFFVTKYKEKNHCFWNAPKLVMFFFNTYLFIFLLLLELL